ncbi:MAG TPA: nuclear transport factor 2 family protein [Pyrinomonadaceae bacterium]|jgi:ketosteroid isomerase-like protein|nr:nuclear transport factor 2 family protein [Pyrinomonadaceae bacterium]
MNRTSAICLLILAAAVGVLMPAAAQKTKSEDALTQMVATERSFSRTSEQKGTREAFAAFIAEDGILFRPHAVVGKKWMQEHPLPPSNTRPLLTWQPIYAFMSRSGDLGYTTGPWQYKSDIKDAKPSAFGNFMTIWRKQADGTWKFVLDLGIDNPEPKNQPKLVYGATPVKSKATNPIRARADLLNSDREFSRASAKRGSVEAFLSFAAEDVRVFRNGHEPFVGRRRAVVAMRPLAFEWRWEPDFGSVSASDDLAYTYGTYQLRDKAKQAVIESGNYARVWKKFAGMWRVVIDVANPVKGN